MKESYFRALLDLRAATAPSRVLRDALALLVALVDASRARIELSPRPGRDPTFVVEVGTRGTASDAILRLPIITWSAIGTLSLHRSLHAPSFSSSDLDLIELLAREVRAIADRLVLAELSPLREATRRLHAHLVVEALLRTGWNVTRAARALGVTRTFVYAVLRATGSARCRRGG